MDRLLLLFIALSLSKPIHADTIKCYSGDKVIYYRDIRNLTFTGDVFLFQEKSGRIVMYSGNCIVKLDA